MLFESSNDSISGLINVGAAPFGVAFSADGTKAFVTNFDDNTVSVINVANNTVTGTLGVGTDPTEVALTPAGVESSLAYVVNAVTGNVSVIDVKSSAIIATVTVGTNPQALAITPLADLEVMGVCERNRFLTQDDLFTIIGWPPPPVGVTVTEYRIYRDEAQTDLLKVVTGRTIQDHNLSRYTTYSYFIQGFNGSILVTNGSISLTCK